MGNRKITFVQGEYYHIFNRGVDKRDIFMDKYEAFRFIQSMKEFNNIEAGNDIFLINKSRKVGGATANPNKQKKKLVNIICYCLNSNHYHIILEQLVDGGISEFMRRLNGGYTWYFNNKYKRNGALFQGTFKAVHIETNKQLLHASVYVGLNDKIHRKLEKNNNKKHFLELIPNRSSWEEYINKDAKYKICAGTDIIIGQFENREDYKKFAEETLKGIKERRYEG